MFCRKCGVLNDDNAFKCVKCGEILQQVTIMPPAPMTKIPNYLVQAILVTLCCCLPFGIVSIVYAAQVNTKIQTGDIRGALDASDKAKTWCWVGFGIGLLSNIIILGLEVIGALSNLHQQGY